MALLAEGQVMQVLSLSSQFTDSDSAALRKAISTSFLLQEDWHEGPHGEIVNAKGRTRVDIGFANAIRKSIATKLL